MLNVPLTGSQPCHGRCYGLRYLERLATLSGKYFIQQQKDLGAANGYIEEMMQGQKVVKVFCHEEKSIEEFKKLNDELFHSADNANKFANIAMPANAQTWKYQLCYRSNHRWYSCD